MMSSFFISRLVVVQFFFLVSAAVRCNAEKCSYASLFIIQGWAMKREDFKGEVGLTVVEWGGGELASPLLQVLPFSSNAAVDG